ncbi:hypothetical protein DCC39_13110 [Pueribacillus theae]|uniref:Peroxiredoxin n=1 Tax=Pueribacillus theae TaxID=2171751 RepID=A0A2U1JWD0_9BACI|nr:OsmC family protein [Pueribacillus theae]PWA09432.1 hypothetical protein DCC39_13110 [Pueribacillus theae]
MIDVRWSDSGYNIINDSNFEMKGASTPRTEGLTPIELLESSLGLCVAITINQILVRDGYGQAEVQVSVKAKKAKSPPSRVEKFLVDIRFPEGNDLKEEYRGKLIMLAERACTIGNTLQQGAAINMKETLGRV